MSTTKWVVFSTVGLVALILIFTSFGTVSSGEIGIRTRLNEVIGTKGPGLYAVVPFMESVEPINVQTQKEQVDVEAASSDLQDVHTVIALNYNVESDKVADLYVRVGTSYKTVIIDPAVQEAVKASTAKYTASDLIQNRPKVRDAIQKDLAVKLSENFIQVSDVSIVDFRFSETFNRAIEAKVTAEQNALASKNLLEQKKYEAEQTVVTAQAQAEAIKIQASAINSQGGADYVALQAIGKWNGVLPIQMIPGSSVPFINVNAR